MTAATDLKTRIRNVVAVALDIPPSTIDDTTSSTTVEEWDSMNHIQLIVALEGEFGVSFEPERAVELVSVAEIERALIALGVT
ncbi:MAG TPA: acyl carrier protein [Acidimicrobiia bacterium]|jgi:acyl carrier protein|nr:acyl carrier protein [Acidimicrobiia bacterium]